MIAIAGTTVSAFGIMRGAAFDSVKLQKTVRDYIARGRKAAVGAEKDYLFGMARSYLTLAKNAAWLTSTDVFLNAIENRTPWPRPNGAVTSEPR